MAIMVRIRRQNELVRYIDGPALYWGPYTGESEWHETDLEPEDRWYHDGDGWWRIVVPDERAAKQVLDQIPG